MFAGHRGDDVQDAQLAAAAVGSADVAIITVDLTGAVTWWNPAAETLFGYRAEEALGRFIGDLIIPPDAHDDWIRRRRLLGTQRTQFRDVVRRRRRDGSEFATDMATAPLCDDSGAVIGTVATFREAWSSDAANASLEQIGLERALLARAVDTSPLYVIAWDAEGVVVLARGAGAPGQLRFAPDLLGKSIFDLYDESTGIHDAVRRTLAGEEGETVITYGRRRLQVAFRTMRTDDGAIVGGVGSGLDITELVETSEALRRAQIRTAAVLRHVSEIIILSDADTRLLEVIIGESGGFGYRPEDVIGRIGWEFVHPDDLPRVQAMVEALLTEPGGRRQQVSFRLRLADGAWGWAEETVTNALDDPDIGAIITNLRDVTDIRRAEQSLRESEQRYRNVVEASTDAIAVLDRSGEIVLANPRFGELLGQPVDELTGRQLDDLALPTPVAGVAAEPVRCELRGRTRWLRVSSRPLSAVDPEGARLVVVADDTDRMTLQQRVLEMERLEAIGRFASGVAHDFNNALSTVRGHAELLAEQTDVDSPQRSDADAIVRGADRAAAMVEQLLAFARGRELRLQPSDINDLVHDALNFTGRMCERDVEVTFERSAVPLVDVDPGQMERVLVNLVLNACESGAEHVRVEVRPVDGAVEVHVTDDGKGMTEDELAHCFEPFFTTKGAQGTGLGLATVYGIVTHNGGTVDVTSSAAGGTTFVVRVPVHSGEA